LLPLENQNNRGDQSTEKSNNLSGLLIGIGKKLLVLIVIGLAIQFTLPQITSFQNNITVIKSIKTWILGLAIIAQFCSYVGNGIITSELVKSAHRQFSIMRGLMISLASTSIGMVAGGMFGAGAATFRLNKFIFHKASHSMASICFYLYLNPPFNHIHISLLRLKKSR
jgi:uncharacterized membrane protein YbhN (UPF0104 family)